jgi:hypothetical protein
VTQCLDAARAAVDVFGETTGHKFKDGKYESAVNRTVFEMQALPLANIAVAKSARGKKASVVKGFQRLCMQQDFLGSLEATTKSIENYQLRFDRYTSMLRRVTGKRVDRIKFGA